MFDFLLGVAVGGSVAFFARPWVESVSNTVWSWVKSKGTKADSDSET